MFIYISFCTTFLFIPYHCNPFSPLFYFSFPCTDPFFTLSLARNVLAPCENHRFLQETNIGAGTQRCSGCHRVLFGISGKYLRCESCGVMVHTRCAPRPAAAISSEWSPVSLPGMPPTATELPPASSSATSATSATSAAAAVALLSVSEDGDSARSKSPTPAPPSFGEETPVSTPKKGAWLWPFHKGGGRAQEH